MSNEGNHDCKRKQKVTVGSEEANDKQTVKESMSEQTRESAGDMHAWEVK